MIIFPKKGKGTRIIKQAVLLLSIVLVLSLISFKYLKATPSNESHGKPYHIELLIEKEGDEFRIVSQKMRQNEGPKKYRQIARDGLYLIEFLNGSGNVLRFESIPDPTEIFYDYSDGRTIQGGRVNLSKAQFALSFPNEYPIRIIKISKIKKSAPQRRLEMTEYRIESGIPFFLPDGLKLEHKATLNL